MTERSRRNYKFSIILLFPSGSTAEIAMSLVEGKSVIVTGSSSGIGLATAVMFASRGSNVTVCGRDTQRVTDAVKSCEEARTKAGHSGNKIISVAGDITDQSVIKETVEKTLDAFGQLDVVVANHGVSMSDVDMSVDTWTPECFDATMNSNVKSYLALIQEAVPHLKKSRGNVVCVSSIGSSVATPSQTNYVISKAAVDHMTRCLALQLGPNGMFLFFIVVVVFLFFFWRFFWF